MLPTVDLRAPTKTVRQSDERAHLLIARLENMRSGRVASPAVRLEIDAGEPRPLFRGTWIGFELVSYGHAREGVRGNNGKR